MNYYVSEGNFVHIAERRENHSRNPEGNYIVASNEYVGREEASEVLRFVGITHSAVRPERARKPRIENVFVLMKTLASAFRTAFRLFLETDLLPAVLAVIYGNPVSPPELTGNAPIPYVFHPMEISLFEILRNEPDISVFNRVYRRTGKRFHPDEPLLAYHRLDRRMTAVTFSDVMGIILNLDELSELLHFRDDFLSRFETVEPAEQADEIMRKALSLSPEPKDDMTVIVASLVSRLP